MKSPSEQQAKRAGLTGAQYQLLLAIRGHGGPPSVGEVAAHLMLRHHSVVELAAAHLEELSRLRPRFDQLWKHLPAASS